MDSHPKDDENSMSDGHGEIVESNGRSSIWPKNDTISLSPDGSTLVAKSELLRLIMQSLTGLGFDDVVKQLEKQSHIKMEEKHVTAFRQKVLDGEWEHVLALIQGSQFISEEPKKKQASFVILRQKYLELLEQKKLKEALQTLRFNLTDVASSPAHLHELSTYLMFPSPEELRKSAKWSGSGVESRQQLLNELRQFISPSLLLPDDRLLSLLNHVIESQRSKCLYHNVVSGAPFSLFQDHICTRSHFPRTTYQILKDHSDEVWNLKFSASGRYLATASKDHSVMIYEILPLSATAGSSFAVSARPFNSGSHVIPTTPAASSSGLSSIGMANGKKEYERSVSHRIAPRPPIRLSDCAHEVSIVAWSPDETMLLTGSGDNKIRLYDRSTGKLKREFAPIHSDNLMSIVWLPDGVHFLSASTDRKLIQWNIEGRTVRRWMLSRLYDLVVTPDGKEAIAIDADKRIRIISLVTDKIEDIKEIEPATSLTISQDGRFLLLNFRRNEMERNRDPVGESYLHLWDLAKRELVSTFRGQQQDKFILRSCFGGVDCSFIASGSEDGNVCIWHRASGQLLEKLPGHSATVNAVAWSPTDPSLFASASDDGTVRLWSSEVL